MDNAKNDFDNYKKDNLVKPRDLAWTNWAKLEKIGDKVQGHIRDAFYRAEDGQYQAQRGITLEQLDGVLINVGVKRLPFILNKTDNMHIGDPLTIELVELKESATKGFSATKILGFFGVQKIENSDNPTVKELDEHDFAGGGSTDPVISENEIAF